MKSIFRILILTVVPILMVTAIVDQGLAADKGSQLIFRSNMAPEHKSFISIANAHSSQAVTVLTQYYNDEMEMVLWYLRVLPADGNVLVDPYDHMIPGSEINSGDHITGTGKVNSGHFVIAVTAVGANLKGVPTDVDTQTAAVGNIDAEAVPNTENTVNVLFPTFLAEDLDGMDNIDNGGVLTSDIPDTAADADAGETTLTNNLMLTKFEATDDQKDDNTSKNVGDLRIDNAEPIAFNHLSGHFTEALVSIAEGGSDQTASWGGTPTIRPAVVNTANAMDVAIADYQTLDGANAEAETGGGRLAEKDAGGNEAIIYNMVEDYVTAGGNTGDGEIRNGAAYNRGLKGGALVLPALHGGGEQSHQIMLMLSAADEFGGAGKYELMPAKTGYMVTLMDAMGDALPNPMEAEGPVFGGTEDPEDDPAGLKIIVEGIRVMVDAGKCDGTMIVGPWTLAHLTSSVPTASSGAKDFDGLDAMTDGMMPASPGWIKFMRTGLECEMDYGDTDGSNNPAVEDPDGVPVSDKRTYKAGTLIVEEKNTDRAFITTGQALLKFITAKSTFAASWSLKSPPTGPDTARDMVDPDGADGTLTEVPDDIVTPGNATRPTS